MVKVYRKKVTPTAAPKMPRAGPKVRDPTMGHRSSSSSYKAGSHKAVRGGRMAGSKATARPFYSKSDIDYADKQYRPPFLG